MKLTQLLKASVLALVAMAVLTGPADAQRRREREEAKQEESLYPNATRKEPSASANERQARQLQKLQDLYDEDKQDEALAFGDEILGNAKSTPYMRSFVLQTQAFIWMDKDDYPKAMKLLGNVLEENALPNDSHYQLMYTLAQLQFQEEQYDTALQTLDRFMTETKSATPDQLGLKGNMLYRLERYPEAVEVLKQAIAASGDKPKDVLRQQLMASYFEMNQPAEAAKIAEELLRKNPDDKSAILNTAIVYAQADQFDKAAALLDSARQRGLLTDERDYRQLYTIYANMDGKERETIAVINEGLDKGVIKPSAEVYSLLGQSYYYSEQIPQAIEAYKKAAPLGKDGELYLNLARVLSGEGRDAEAKEAAQMALQRGVRNTKDANTIIARAK